VTGNPLPSHAHGNQPILAVRIVKSADIGTFHMSLLWKSKHASDVYRMWQIWPMARKTPITVKRHASIGRQVYFCLALFSTSFLCSLTSTKMPTHSPPPPPPPSTPPPFPLSSPPTPPPHPHPKLQPPPPPPPVHVRTPAVKLLPLANYLPPTPTLFVTSKRGEQK